MTEVGGTSGPTCSPAVPPRAGCPMLCPEALKIPKEEVHNLSEQPASVLGHLHVKNGFKAPAAPQSWHQPICSAHFSPNTKGHRTPCSPVFSAQGEALLQTPRAEQLCRASAKGNMSLPLSLPWAEQREMDGALDLFSAPYTSWHTGWPCMGWSCTQPAPELCHHQPLQEAEMSSPRRAPIPGMCVQGTAGPHCLPLGMTWPVLRIRLGLVSRCRRPGCCNVPVPAQRGMLLTCLGRHRHLHGFAQPANP